MFSVYLALMLMSSMISNDHLGDILGDVFVIFSCSVLYFGGNYGTAVSLKFTEVGTVILHGWLPPRPSGLQRNLRRCISMSLTAIWWNIFLISPHATCSAALNDNITDPKWFIGFFPLLMHVFKDLPFLSGCPLYKIIQTGVVDSDSDLYVTHSDSGRFPCQ